MVNLKMMIKRLFVVIKIANTDEISEIFGQVELELKKDNWHFKCFLGIKD